MSNIIKKVKLARLKYTYFLILKKLVLKRKNYLCNLSNIKAK